MASLYWRDIFDTVRLAYSGRERPLSPVEWLSQPALYGEAQRLLLQTFAELEDRK